jgi:hypothetical protein
MRRRAESKAPRQRGAWTITPRAVELFKEMRALQPCVCQWGPKYYHRVECASCRRWWELHWELFNELQLFVGDWPAISHDPDEPPYAEIEGDRVHLRSMSHAGGPAHWDRKGKMFAELMAAAEAPT